MVCAYFIARSHNRCTLCSPFFVPSHRHVSFVAIKEALDVCIFGEVFNVVHYRSVPAFQQQANIISKLHSGEHHVQALPIDLCKKYKIDWKWIKGHSNNKYNDLADDLATRAIQD